MADEVTRSVIGQVVDHFDSRKNAFTFVIPEWGDGETPLTLVASPLTLNQRNRIERQMEERGSFAGYAECAVLALCHADDGAKAFDIADKPKLLRNADSRILQRIGDALLRDIPDIETIKGNLDTAS